MPTLRQIAVHIYFLIYSLFHADQRRHSIRWAASLYPGATLRNPQPWLVFDAIDYLSEIDMRGWQIFEYGSGGSTLYWLGQGACVTSVEHDATWYARVRARIPPDAAIDYRLVPPEPPERPGLKLDPADPAACASASPPRDGRTYRRYVAQIDSFADGSLDMVLVDGRARPSCIARAAPKLRPGGLLILDNSDRGYYTRCNAEALASYRPLVFIGAIAQVPAFSQTTIYIRER
jgi:hypothetical protein